MSDESPRKKTLREEVEEYKRKQREAEESAAALAGEGDEDERLASDVNDALARGPDVGRLVGGIFAVVGILLLAACGAITWFTLESIAGEVETPGVVVRNELRHYERSSNSSSSSRGSRDLYHAVVEFKLADGTSKTVEMSAGYWRRPGTRARESRSATTPRIHCRRESRTTAP